MVNKNMDSEPITLIDGGDPSVAGTGGDPSVAGTGGDVTYLPPCLNCPTKRADGQPCKECAKGIKQYIQWVRTAPIKELEMGMLVMKKYYNNSARRK